MAEEADDAYVQACLKSVLAGKLQAVLLEDLARRLAELGRSRCRALLARALAPQLAGLRGASAADLDEQWSDFHTAASVLAELTAGEDWGGKVLARGLLAAAARAVLSPAGDAAVTQPAVASLRLEEAQCAALAQLRADPDALDSEALSRLRSRAALLEQPCADGARRRGYVERLQSQCADAARSGLGNTLHALAKGVPPEGWAARCARSIEVEGYVDGLHCGGAWEASFHRKGRLTSICAGAWLANSVAVLPWIFAWLLAPVALEALAEPASGGEPGAAAEAARLTLAGLRAALDSSADPTVLRQLQDAFTTAVGLLFRLACAAAPPSSAALGAASVVAWAAAVLTAADLASRALLYDLASAAVAAAVAPVLALVVDKPSELQALPAPPWGSVPGIAGPLKTSSALGLGQLASRVHAACAGLASTEKLGNVPEALAFAIHEEVLRFGTSRSEGAPHHWPGKLGPLLLLYHLLPDSGGPLLRAQARLAGLRALRAPWEVSKAEAIEERLAGFFREECGAGHPALRHLAELRRDAAGRGLLPEGLEPAAAAGGGGAGAASQSQSSVARCAVIVNSASAAALDLSTTSLALGATVPAFFRLSEPLMAERATWTKAYASSFPHRRLRWLSALGRSHLLWRHARGSTEVAASELQAHLLLALGRHREVAEAELRKAFLEWEGAADDAEAAALLAPWSRALEGLCGCQGPLERSGSGRVVLKDSPPAGCEVMDLDTAALLATAGDPGAASAAEEGGPGGRDAAARAPLIDAALMRLLKRWHVLAREDLLARLAAYPTSLELQAAAPAATSAAFAAARAGAAAGGAEALARLQSLCDRGFVRAEGPEGVVDAAGAGSGTVRYYYED